MPTVLASGPPITSPGGHCWNMGGQARGVDELCRAVQHRAERGVDIVKIMASGGVSTPGTDAFAPQFTIEELRAVVDAAHAAGLLVTAHAHPLTAIRDAVAAGVDAIEHGTFATETGIEVPNAVVASLVESAIPVCPTLGKAWGVVLTPASLEFMRKTGLTYEVRVQTVGQLHRAGVHLVSGSDDGINPSRRHGGLAEAVIDLVAGGVCTADALASVNCPGSGPPLIGSPDAAVCDYFVANDELVAELARRIRAPQASSDGGRRCRCRRGRLEDPLTKRRNPRKPLRIN
ncbi:MAG TPA: amidohydrolase family protein [Pseudonocardiaceae bacterium]|nr:amidohydrolase family protein [Pseudonocardiaceae bacterium]